MRRIAMVVLKLAVIVGLAFPMVAPKELALAGTAAHSHGAHIHDANAHASALPDPDAADCNGGACADDTAWEGCLDGAIHCVTALLTAGSDASVIGLPRDANHRLPQAPAAPHHAPETEVPPPRL